MILWNNLLRVLNNYGEELKDAYKNELADKGINATKALSDSVEYYIEFDGGAYEVSLNLLEYWKWAENGRDKGKWPPSEPIMKWITAKPVIPRPDRKGKLPTIKQLTFLVQRAIGENGTFGQHPLENTVEKVNDKYLTLIYDAIEQDILESLNS